MRYISQDASAVAGRHYDAFSGDVVFQDKESVKSLDVCIKKNSSWEPALDFTVRLGEPIGCNLGMYLHHCHINILDSSPFPGSSGGLRSFIDYWLLTFRMSGMKHRTLLHMLTDQVCSLCTLLVLLLTMNLIDELMYSSEDLDGWNSMVALIGGLYVGAAVVSFLLDIVKWRIDVGGRARELLQMSLVRKYLHFGEQARSELHHRDVEVALLSDAADLAAAYTATLDLLRLSGRFLALAAFLVCKNRAALLWLMAMLLPVAFSCARRGLTGACRRLVHCKVGFDSSVIEAITKFRLLSDLGKRHWTCRACASAMGHFRAARLCLALMRTNGEAAPQLFGAVCIGAYVATQSGRVAAGAFPLGLFLTTLLVFRLASETLAQCCREVVTVSMSEAPLRRTASCLNKDQEEQEDQEDKDEEFIGEVARGCADRADNLGPSCAVLLRLQGVSFGYPGRPLVLQDVNVSVPQGMSVAVVGPHGSGRSTLLRLLGGVLRPSSGCVRVPPHLRVLHVSQDACLLRRSVWQNLTIGCPYADTMRVKRILDSLGMWRTLQMLNDELHVEERRQGATEPMPAVCGCFGTGCVAPNKVGAHEAQDVRAAWQDTLHSAERSKLHLARALIANPEVLVLQRPMHAFDEFESLQVLGAITAHVQNRGLCLPESTASFRQPRTCFFTPETSVQALKADVIWKIVAETRSVRETPVAGSFQDERLAKNVTSLFGQGKVDGVR